MSCAGQFTLYGSNASPYSCKMRALMRYRRLPFNWVILNPMEIPSHPNPNIRSLKARVIPILEWPDGRVLNDSTVIIEALDADFPRSRDVLPRDASQRFMVKLLEDFFDEWFMKAMFNRRWSSEADRDWSSRWIITDQLLTSPTLRILPSASDMANLTAVFRERQVSRVKLVGCEDDELWQRVMYEVMEAMDEQLRFGDAVRFLFSYRPTSADFSLYGILKQFSLDSTGGHVLREQFPSVYCWIQAMDDLSGLVVEGEFQYATVDTPAVRKILNLVDTMYLPYLAANAVRNRGEEVEVKLTLKDGVTFVHKEAFGPYQKRCFEDLKAQYKRLAPSQRAAVAQLVGPGMDHLLADEHSKL
ncbi:hypothetical protein FOL47_009333 [Perkinsus chesapeaki]|uniref:GST N-terminal domain-containing protein n=1 Tax=Perkinsus chesapeaki TaxID=330153 RepID=A0A7J6L8Z1_PERCH|nr:hypothetical protein FOL47_009333 [Perkinsus chesapeaki]